MKNGFCDVTAQAQVADRSAFCFLLPRQLSRSRVMYGAGNRYNYSSFFLSWHLTPRHSLKTARGLPGELLGKLMKLTLRTLQ